MSSMYVGSGLEENLFEATQTGELVVLHGPVGMGKSTQLLRLASDLADRADDLQPECADARVLYLDAHDYTNRFSTTGRSLRFDLCYVAAQRIFAMVEFDEPSTIDRYLDSVSTFDTGDGVPVAADRAALERDYSFPAELFANLWGDADGFRLLTHIVQFLQSADLGIDLFILVDNVDQLDSDAQAVIARKMAMLLKQGLAGAAVAIRTENLAHLNLELDEIDVYHEFPLPSDLISANRLMRIMQARLDFALGQETNGSTFGDESERETLESVFQVLFGVRVPEDRVYAEERLLLPAMRWNNGSVRAACIDSFDVVSAIVGGSDPLVTPFGRATPTARLSRSPSNTLWHSMSPRTVRTIGYRHLLARQRSSIEWGYSLVLSDWTTRRGGRMSVRAASHERSRDVESADSLLAPLLILTWLSRRSSVYEYVPIGDMANGLEHVGLAAGTIDDAVAYLSQGHNRSRAPFVRLSLDGKSTKRPNREASILVEDSGRWLVNGLASSVEYLFWTAMCRSDGDRYLPMGVPPSGKHRRGSVLWPTAELVLDDWYRAFVVWSFLDKRLWPTTEAWLAENQAIVRGSMATPWIVSPIIDMIEQLGAFLSFLKRATPEWLSVDLGRRVDRLSDRARSSLSPGAEGSS